MANSRRRPRSRKMQPCENSECGIWFMPERRTQRFCGIPCASVVKSRAAKARMDAICARRDTLPKTQEEAKELGSKYYTGPACPSFHLGYRYTQSGACAICKSERDPRQRHNHKRITILGANWKPITVRGA